MRRNPFFALFLLACLALALPRTAKAQGCPMCKKSVESAQAGGVKIGRGLNKAILYLMLMPFSAVGTIGAIYAVRARRANQA